MAANLSRLKSTQYLLICRAGLAVSAESEAASEELKRDMLQEFKDAVEKFSMSDDLKGYPTDILTLWCYAVKELYRSKCYDLTPRSKMKSHISYL